jgi:FRG domain
VGRRRRLGAVRPRQRPARHDAGMTDMAVIHSWRELDDAVAGLGAGSVHAPWVFRGLARASYSNTSSLARLGDDFPPLERHLIRNFQKYAHRERPGSTLWDWLSLAQHHGLPTRLLDWTFSPFVAAHFATATSPEHDAVVWAVDCQKAHEELPAELRAALEAEGALVFTTELLAAHAPNLDALDRLSEKEPFALFFEPPSLDERIINQSAVLSLLSDPRAQMEDWFEAHTDACCAWRITADAKAEIRERLDQGNITERVLMPGLDGLAAWLRRYYTGRSASGGDDGGAAMVEHGAASGTGQGEADA